MALPAMEFTQYANYKKICIWIKTAQEQVQHLSNVISNQLRMIEDMKRQAMIIPDAVYFNTAHAVNDVAAIVRQGQLVVGSMSDFDEQFKRKIEGYKRSFKRELQAINKPSFSNFYRELNDDNMRAIKGVIKTIQAENWNFSSHEKIKENIKAACESSNGRNSLLQANSMLRDYQIKLLEKLNNTVTAQANMEATLSVTKQQVEERKQYMKERIYESKASEAIRGNGISFP